jgi:hypothetical protein
MLRMSSISCFAVCEQISPRIQFRVRMPFYTGGQDYIVDVGAGLPHFKGFATGSLDVVGFFFQVCRTSRSFFLGDFE